MTEHRLEDAFPLASRVAVMRPRTAALHRESRGGGGDPARGGTLNVPGHADPDADLASAPDAGGHCPVTVREGRDWLTGFADGHPLGELPAESRHVYPDEPAITAEGCGSSTKKSCRMW